MTNCRKFFFAPILLCLASPAGPHQQQEMFHVKSLLQKDLSSYAGEDMLLTVGEITLAPGPAGTRHRHPGPTFVYVLEGTVEIELEALLRSFYEEPHQLHIATKNVSQTERARIMAYHLSRKGEPLTQPEK